MRPVDPIRECRGTGNFFWSNTKGGGCTIGDSYLFRDLVDCLGTQWDDEAIQRRDKSSSHRRWRTYLPLPGHRGSTIQRFSKTDKKSLKRMGGMLILLSMREEEQEWVEEADGYCGNDNDVDLEEQFGYLGTAEACARTDWHKSGRRGSERVWGQPRYLGRCPMKAQHAVSWKPGSWWLK